MSNNLENDLSYDFFHFIYTYIEPENPAMRLINKRIEQNKEISEHEFEAIIHLAWSLAYQKSMEDGFITLGEQQELDDIKKAYVLYQQNPSLRITIRQHFKNQFIDLQNVENLDNKNKELKIKKNSPYYIPKSPFEYNWYQEKK